MAHFIQKIQSFLAKPYTPLMILVCIIAGIYYKLFLFGKIPFPGDLLIVSYSPWLDYYKFPVQNPLISDAFSQFFLWKYQAIDSFKHLAWPLWNPYSFTGTPLLATFHSAALYPLNLLLLLPKFLGWGVFIFAQTMIAAINMYLLLSIWLDSRLARLVGAVMFAFGGLMTTWLELGTAVHAISWLPLAFYFIGRYWQKLKTRYLLALMLSLILLILAGNVQILTYSFIILSIYAFIFNSYKNNQFYTHFLPVCLSLIVAIIISAPQILPTLDLFQKSIRVNDSYTSSADFGLLPILDSFRFFIADFLGNPVTRNYWGFLNYSETSGFLGTISLPLLIFAIIYLKKNKISIFFLTLFLISLLLAFKNPLSTLIYQTNIPLLTASYASRILFITVFSASILCAFSLNQIIKLNQNEKFFKVVTWSFAILIGILLGLLVVFIDISRSSHDIVKNAPNEFFKGLYLNTPNLILNNFKISLRNTILPILIICSLFISFLFAKRFKKKKITFILYILIVVLVFDLGRYFLKFNPFISQDLIFPTTPSLKFLINQPAIFRIGREHAEVLPPNTWSFYNLYSFEGYDPLYLNQYAKYMNFLNSGNIKSGAGRYAEFTSNYQSPYLNATNIKYFIAILRDRLGRIPGDQLDYRFKETDYKVVFKDKSAAILQNPHALERVYFAKNIFTSTTSNIENVFIEDKNFDPTKTVGLSKDLKISKISNEGVAEITYYSPNIVKINTKTINDEVLVLADQYEDGWRAYVDGQSTIISPANLIFRAIKVPSGTHEIIFNYWPKSFDIGLKVFLISILIIISLSVIAVKTKRF